MTLRAENGDRRTWTSARADQTAAICFCAEQYVTRTLRLNSPSAERLETCLAEQASRSCVPGNVDMHEGGVTHEPGVRARPTSA